MLNLAAIFSLLAILTAAFGYSGDDAGGLSKTLFVIFAGFTLLSLMWGVNPRRPSAAASDDAAT